MTETIGKGGGGFNPRSAIALAKAIRPYLWLLGNEFRLPRGILGIAFDSPDASDDVYYADFVGADQRTPPSVSDADVGYIEQHSYVLANDLFSDEKKLSFSFRRHHVERNGTGSFTPHLRKLFHKGLPPKINFFRIPLYRRACILYYVGAANKRPGQLDSLVRHERMIVLQLRSFIYEAAASGEVTPADASALLKCLPDGQCDPFSAALLRVAGDISRYKATLEGYQFVWSLSGRQKHMLVLSAGPPNTEPMPLFEVHPSGSMLGPKTINLVKCQDNRQAQRWLTLARIALHSVRHERDRGGDLWVNQSLLWAWENGPTKSEFAELSTREKDEFRAMYYWRIRRSDEAIRGVLGIDDKNGKSGRIVKEFIVSEEDQSGVRHRIKHDVRFAADMHECFIAEWDRLDNGDQPTDAIGHWLVCQQRALRSGIDEKS